MTLYLAFNYLFFFCQLVFIASVTSNLTNLFFFFSASYIYAKSHSSTNCFCPQCDELLAFFFLVAKQISCAVFSAQSIGYSLNWASGRQDLAAFSIPTPHTGHLQSILHNNQQLQEYGISSSWIRQVLPEVIDHFSRFMI